ncbi:MAG: SGNH/GDSL hydrolase family protein [Bacteroidales bacterium]|nr:SGNH/GDSL hydrolase family protein [Bacteroidales bacterium]
MKKTVLIALLLICTAFGTIAQNKEWVKVEASDLTLLGKAFDTPNPYHRIDTVVYKGFTKRENEMCRYSAGLAVMFKTNATDIGIAMGFGQFSTASFRSYRGVDLYIKKDGAWTWAGMNDFSTVHTDASMVKTVVKHMDTSVKECIMYLPTFSEVTSCEICVPEGSFIEPLESPFRHKIVFHGSSFTHGHSTTRAGMSYPMQFMRRTGMQVIPLGFSGRCMMQSYFADVLEDIEADAYVFDPFSNPNTQLIKERLLPFIERMVKAHPGKPIIIQQTIYWEKENFDLEARKEFTSRRNAADSLMKIACKKYKDVYFIVPDAALHNGESSTADGVHPNDNGYSLWERSIEKPILKILRKYSVK